LRWFCYEWTRTGSVTYLDTIASIDLNLALVVLPNDTELDNALGNLYDFEGFFVFRMFFEERCERRSDFMDSLWWFENRVRETLGEILTAD
jgi:hypothetical protein